ncbi:pyridoxal-phosphate-dependent aminotransferase family protein, partial [Calditerricola satsumensis]
CERYGLITRRLEVAWGEAADPDRLRAFLRQHPKAKAVFLTYCETSTGVLNPVAELARVVREESEALVIVDGVSAIGGAPCEMDSWGLDIVVTGSQKALMLPPGLALVAVSERAWQAIEANPAPRFYLDLLAYRKAAEEASSPYTPAVSLFFGLREALAMIEEETLDAAVARHALLRDMTRAAIKALGLPLLADDAAASPTVTAVGPFDGSVLDPEA